MTLGATWYRYKPASWSSLNANSYGYYYYDLTSSTSNLSLAVQSNVDKIVGTSSTNSYKYATYSDNLNSDTGNLFLRTTKTLGLSSMYSSTVEYQGHEMYLASAYTVVSTNGTKTYYRAYGSSADFVMLAAGATLSDVLQQGAYEFYEIGRYGAVSYYVYVDALSPYLNVTLTSGSDVESSVVDLSGAADSTLYGKSFTITSINDVDEWTVVEVYRSGVAVLQMTIDEFTGYTFSDSGTYYIYVFDRSGNQTSLTITLKSTDIELSHSSASASSYVFNVTTRSSSEITALAVEFNGTSQTTDGAGTSLTQVPYVTSFTFYYSGVYTITISDRYGYVYSESITLEKDLPDVTILVYDGTNYVNISEYTDFYTLSEDGTTYTIITPAALYIRWDASNSYTLTWNVEPDESDYTYTSSARYERYSINASTSGWMATIGYSRDPYASIKIISLTDDTAPIISVSNSGETVCDGDKINAQYVTIAWSELESAMSDVVYSFGGVTVSLDATGDSCTLGSKTAPLEEGTYIITATNVLGLSSTFTFTIDTSIDLYVQTSEGITEYEKDATVYENEDIQILLTEQFYITIDSDLYSYTIIVSYGDEGVSMMIYDANLSANEQSDVYDFALDDLNAITNGSVYSDTSGYTDLFMEEFGLYLGKTGAGQLYLGIAALKDEGESIYTVNVEESGVDITLDFVICSDPSDIVVRFSSTNESDVLTFDADGGFMNNTPVYIYEAGQDLTNIVSISYTFDDGESVTIYDGTTFTAATLEAEGTYVITIVNKYGTITEHSIRIYSSIIINAYVVYDDGTELETNSTIIYSNSAVRFEGVSRTTYTVSISEFVFTLSKDGTMYEFTISAVGSYSFTITDEYGNSCDYVVIISEAKNITLSDKDAAFSGWDEDALRADELFTDNTVSFVSSFLSDNNISYITYEYYAGINSDSVLPEADSSGILLDKITGAGIDETDTIIGWLGDGLYIIRMYDNSGNLVTYNASSDIAISYKSAAQFVLYRVTQDNEQQEEYSLELAAEQGFYSNYSLIFDISAKYYEFTVDGQSVTLSSGTYTITAENDAASASYVITYVDEYGNKTQFTAYIYTEKPQIEYEDSDILITVSSVTYAVGNPVLTSSGIGVTAYYYKDGSDTLVSYTIGEEISGDGEYLLYFVDIAGNISSVNFVIDTVVSWKLGAGSATNYDVIFSGAVTSRNVRLMKSSSEDLVLVSVTLNGVDVTSKYSNTTSSSTCSKMTASTWLL